MTTSIRHPSLPPYSPPAPQPGNAVVGYLPYALKPTLKPWLDAGKPSEQRPVAVNRIVDFWLNDDRETVLDFADLPLSELPPVLHQFKGLRTLRIQGEQLSNFAEILTLHRECEVYLAEGVMKKTASPELKALNVLIREPGYHGPTVHLDLPVKPAVQAGDSMHQDRLHADISTVNAPGHGNRVAPAVPKRMSTAPQDAGAQRPQASAHSRRSSISWEVFKNACDICHAPVDKKTDIKLEQKRGLFRSTASRLHGKCLLDTFPARADAALKMPNPTRRKPEITFDLIHKTLTAAPDNSRNIGLYLQIVGRLLDRKEMHPELRMQLHLHAADHLPENTNLHIGKRNQTKRECLAQAMEDALQHAPEMIVSISRRLLEELPADTKTFLIGGIEYNRDEISDWSANRNLPTPKVSAAIANMERKMRINNRQNTHDADTLAACAERLAKMRDRISVSRPLDEVLPTIRQYLHEIPLHNIAAIGLERALRRKDVVERFSETIPATLAIVWNYIESVEDAGLRQQLKTALADRFVEIADENPCATGIIDRLTDVPTGIDLSVDWGIPRAQLRAELAHLAGRISMRFDEEYGRHVDHRKKEFEALMSAHGPSTKPMNPDVVVSEIKRDMFIATAVARYVQQRGIDHAMVLEEANNIFPAGTII